MEVGVETERSALCWSLIVEPTHWAPNRPTMTARRALLYPHAVWAVGSGHWALDGQRQQHARESGWRPHGIAVASSCDIDRGLGPAPAA
jgi:hypothetical protein